MPHLEPPHRKISVPHGNLIRASLGVAGVANLAAAYVLAAPFSTFGQAMGLPDEVPALYRALVALFVALFGGAYLWLAGTEPIHRPILLLGAVGKLGAFVLALVLWLLGSVQLPLLTVSCVDLGFAAWWIVWLSPVRASRA